MDLCGTSIKKLAHTMAFCLALTALSASVSPASETSFIEQVSDLLRSKVTDKENQSGLMCRNEAICSIRLMPLLYEERRFAPVWIDAEGLRPTAHALIRAIDRADLEGLQPSDYHLSAIHSMLSDLQKSPFASASERAAYWTDLDMLLTDAFLLLSSHLSGGRVDPETLHSDWVLSEKSLDIMKVLHSLVTEEQIDQVIEQFAPAHAGYGDLRAALAQLRKMVEQGGWPSMPQGPKLRQGDQSMRVLMLRDRLRISGDWIEQALPENPELFDVAVVAALRRFQLRHGVEPDGVLGPRTLEELNVPAEERARQIELNMERWRWLPHDLGRRYIEVNTADYTLSVVEDRQTVLHMRVVIGRPARRTPVFSAPMAYMVINPYWTVPPTIAIEDILPRLVEDVSYLEKNNISVYYGWNENALPIDPRLVDWRAYRKNNFPFRLVQEPGPHNSLGQIKFMFPNQFSVYLHDTPNRSLFGKVQRDFSSGCIRVEDAFALAAYLLKDDADWSVERLHAVLKKGRQQVIQIKEPVPVHLLYMTAWVNGDGKLQFRKDIYKRDRDLDRGLKRKPSGLLPSLEASLR